MLMLTQQQKSKYNTEPVSSDKMGFYIFGGLNENKEPTNDLFHVKPCFKENSDLYDIKNNDFYPHVEPRIYFEIKKITAQGAPPPKRCMHSTENIGGFLYVIGGKNDTLYRQIHNTALNDIHWFDIENKEWKTIALFGYIPMSTWGHSTTVYRGKIVVFGGKNLEKYAPGER